ncbi:ion channel [Yoonia sp. I 8.24]|uniref:ion channel n=1 Tax=Yoonia sp. I 8.24 TaxID=1537229 RepID=UPI001F97E9C7|nr:hypothetical protein [Yoonia sp. I 8.24]
MALKLLREHTGFQHRIALAIIAMVSMTIIYCSDSIIATACLAFLFNAYLMASIIEMSIRSRKRVTEPIFLSLPNREYCFAICLFCITLMILAYAEIYLISAGIKCSEATMQGWIDAIYFSTVTMTTLGYGDCLPITDTAKITIITQLFSGLIGIAAALSAVVSRSIG